MKKHILSLLKSPIGYVANFMATVMVYGPAWFEALVGRKLCSLCETFCLRDGIQDDMMF